jgi:hypothetical protein
MPKLRQGSCFPPLLEPGKVSEKALVAVIQGRAAKRIDGIGGYPLAGSTNWSGPGGDLVRQVAWPIAATKASAAALSA